jgi:mercuric ion binding protein
MKTIVKISILLALITTGVGCKNQTEPEVKTVPSEVVEKQLNPDAEYVTASFEIEGMACPMGCAKPIEKNLAKLDGVKEARVDFETKTATVVYDQAMADQTTFINSVKQTGNTYQVISWNGNQLPSE